MDKFKKLLIFYLKRTNEIIESYTNFNSYINEMNIYEINKWDDTKCRILLFRINDSTDGKAFPWCLNNWNNCKECTYIKYNIQCGDDKSPYQKIITELRNRTDEKYKEIIDIPEIKELIKYIKTKLTIL